MYSQLKVHVPERYHEKIKDAVTKDYPVSIKINLTQDGEQIVLVTAGQLLKIKRAKAEGKKVMTLRMSRKQARANVQFEGGFLSMLMKLATKALPTLLGGLTTGLLGGLVEKAVTGNGLFLGKRGYGTARIDFTEEGKGIMLTPVENENYDGVYLKHNGQIYQGEGILLGENSPFKKFPILGLLF